MLMLTFVVRSFDPVCPCPCPYPVQIAALENASEIIATV